MNGCYLKKWPVVFNVTIWLFTWTGYSFKANGYFLLGFYWGEKNWTILQFKGEKNWTILQFKAKYEWKEKSLIKNYKIKNMHKTSEKYFTTSITNYLEVPNLLSLLSQITWKYLTFYHFYQKLPGSTYLLTNLPEEVGT